MSRAEKRAPKAAWWHQMNLPTAGHFELSLEEGGQGQISQRKWHI